MRKDSRIFIVGHHDIIDDALFQYFQQEGYSCVFSSAKMDLNLLIPGQVEDFFRKENIEFVFLTSTRSGGIEANQKCAAEFFYHNLVSQTHVIHAAHRYGVKKLLYVASSCIYPPSSPQPIKANSLLTGALEPTNEAYAIAKIAGVKMCQAYKRQYGFNAIAMTPATVYGPGSDADLEKAHVLGALVAKFHAAVTRQDKEVLLWGSGRPKREFLYTDDFVSACFFLMEHYEGQEIINAGPGTEVSIKDLAQMTARVTGFQGKIVFDKTRPDGAMRKLLDSTLLRKMGWASKVNLAQGIEKTYQWYLKNVKH